MANPGVYLMDKDSRLMDALAAAGGLLPEADWSGLNLAATLYDTQKIEIPYRSDGNGAVASPPPNVLRIMRRGIQRDSKIIGQVAAA